MKKLLFTLLLTPLILNSAHSQNNARDWYLDYVNNQTSLLGLAPKDEILYERIYRIWIGDYQVVEFTLNRNSKLQGKLVNIVRKTNNRRTKEKTLKEELLIPDWTADKLFKVLEQNDIEYIIDCSDIDGYVIGTDGRTITFEIFSGDNDRIYNYWEPMNDNYQDGSNPQLAKVRNIVNALEEEIELWGLYNNYLNSLPPGTYLYGMIVMKKR